ncbi:MAG: protein kinase, partial [Acidobacteriota bacterium]|nr:protein kinase [Acidobacteriota bacterium]
MASFLIIERDEQTAERLRHALVQGGWQAHPFYDVDAAMQLPQDEAPDVVFVEAGLEKGTELLQRFRRRNARSASVALVSDPTSPVQQAAMKAGDQVLHRPISEDALWAVIRALEATAEAPAEKPQQPSRAQKFTSEDIFGDLLLEVESDPDSGSQPAPEEPSQPPAAAAPSPPPPTGAPSTTDTPPAPRPPAQRPSASTQSDKDEDAINRRLEQTLSGVLGPRRKKPAPPKPTPTRGPEERPIREALGLEGLGGKNPTSKSTSSKSPTSTTAGAESPAKPKKPRKTSHPGLGDVDKLLSETLSGLDLGPRQRPKAKPPADKAPAAQTPADQAPADQAPADQAPADSPSSKPPAAEAPATEPPRPVTPPTPTPAPPPAAPEAPPAPPEEPRAAEPAEPRPPSLDAAADPLSAFDMPLPGESATGAEPRPAEITPLGEHAEAQGPTSSESAPPDEAAPAAAAAEAEAPYGEATESPSSPGTGEQPLEYPSSAPDSGTGTGSMAPAEPNLGELAGSFSTQKIPTVPSGRVDPKPGQTFGPYTLLERIAVGGMAEVWKARMDGVAGFQKTVAIKKILPQLTENEEFEKMFVDEAKLAAELNHPNIIHIYDLGEIHSEYYIAMEYVEGKDLRSLLNLSQRKRMALPPGLALLIAMRLASALDYAHRKRDADDHEMGLVHRDVSPQNVLISHEGDIKLCDFGIVKAVAKSSKTQMGALKGKLQYMSPEQAWGQDVDSRSDIFSLGAILFEMLTGQRLFEGDSELSILDSVRNGEVRTPRALDASIPEELDQLVGRAVAQKPENRFQTAGAMREEIEGVMDRLSLKPTGSDLGAFIRRLQAAPVAPPPTETAPPETPPAEPPSSKAAFSAPAPAGEADPADLWPPPSLDLPDVPAPTEWEPESEDLAEPQEAGGALSGEAQAPKTTDDATPETPSAARLIPVTPEEEAPLAEASAAKDSPLASPKAESPSAESLEAEEPKAEDSKAEKPGIGSPEISPSEISPPETRDAKHDDTGPLVDAVPPSADSETPKASSKRWIWIALILALLAAAAAYYFLSNRGEGGSEPPAAPSATSTGLELPAESGDDPAGDLPDAGDEELDSPDSPLGATSDGAAPGSNASETATTASAADLAREEMEKLQAEQLAQEKQRLQQQMEARERELQEKLDSLKSEPAEEATERSASTGEAPKEQAPAAQEPAVPTEKKATAEQEAVAQEPPEPVQEPVATKAAKEPPAKRTTAAERRDATVATRTAPAQP